MIVIVLRCHTGLTFDFLRFCFIFAKDVKYFEKWKWKVSKYLSWFFNFWSRLRIPRDMEILGVLILLTLVPHLYQKKKKKTGLGNKSKFLFVFYNSVPHWRNIHLRRTSRVSLTRVSSLQEFLVNSSRKPWSCKPKKFANARLLFMAYCIIENPIFAILFQANKMSKFLYKSKKIGQGRVFPKRDWF